MTKFNGHKNWNHWNVSLWINNDEGLYRLAQEAIRHNRAFGRSSREAAVDWFLRAVDAPKTPDGAPYSKSAVRAAMVGMTA